MWIEIFSKSACSKLNFNETSNVDIISETPILKEWNGCALNYLQIEHISNKKLVGQFSIWFNDISIFLGYLMPKLYL